MGHRHKDDDRPSAASVVLPKQNQSFILTYSVTLPLFEAIKIYRTFSPLPKTETEEFSENQGHVVVVKSENNLSFIFDMVYAII